MCGLRIADGDDRPAMGLIYEAINQAREEMRKRNKRRKKRVEPYLKIVDSWWDRQLHKNLPIQKLRDGQAQACYV